MYGALEPYLKDQHNLMAYYRKGEKTLLVIGNYQTAEQDAELPREYKRVLLNNYPELIQKGTTLKLQGYQAVILELN